ncbi:hypothetical protein BaRGS_00009267 [Batillaria attramentaria]|uniref:Uncharacterized protein n=1 Tax=Batillaria attramentaria TaxID=370345 RepID=A0ABD0LJH9_9CAEN
MTTKCQAGVTVCRATAKPDVTRLNFQGQSRRARREPVPESESLSESQLIDITGQDCDSGSRGDSPTALRWGN